MTHQPEVLDALAQKLNRLELTDAEAAALGDLLDGAAAAGDDEVVGFGNRFDAPPLTFKGSDEELQAIRRRLDTAFNIGMPPTTSFNIGMPPT